MNMSPEAPPEWVKDAVFYQIFPDRFAASERIPKPPNMEPWDSPPSPHGFKGGDLAGITEHLDYLQDLGITALFLNPIFQSTANHRYHTHDYFRVDPLLGGDDAFDALLDAAHARSIRVILDGVFNHASRGFFQFNDILENGTASPYLDWFSIKGFPLRAYDRRRRPNYEAWRGLPALPKFNTENPAVREFLFGIGEYWLRRGADGWRLDVPREIRTPGFWEEFRRRVKRVKPDAYLVGEIWNDAPDWLDGTRFDATMNYALTRAALGFFGGDALDTSFRPGGYRLRRFTGRELADEASRLLEVNRWETTLAQLNLLGSHDTPRFLTAVGGDTHRLMAAILFLMAFPGAPCIYYGDEIGLEGGNDPGCRRAFPWDEDRWNRDLRAWARRCIHLRQSRPALRRGVFLPVHAGKTTFAFARRADEELLLAVFNMDRAQVEIVLPVSHLAEDGAGVKDLTADRAWVVSAGTVAVSLAGLSGTLIEITPPDASP